LYNRIEAQQALTGAARRVSRSSRAFAVSPLELYSMSPMATRFPEFPMTLVTTNW
jgi:hypothetical protein